MATPDTTPMDQFATRKPFPACPLVLVGMPGSGKSNIGRRLAARFGLPFADSDALIERDEGMTVAALFAARGEPYFRAAERAVLATLIEGPPAIVATGGGAFMDPETRARIHRAAVSVWLHVPLDVLMERTRGHTGRPLLDGAEDEEDRRARLQNLVAVREPFYAEATIAVDSDRRSHDDTMKRLIAALMAHEAHR